MRTASRQSMVVVLLGTTITSLAASQTAPREASAQQATTIVGCLVQGAPGDAQSDQRAETPAANAKDFFVRTPTVAVPPGTTVTVGQPGTTSTATSSGTPTKDSFYRIAGLDPAQLQPHIGHRVEVQGRLTASAPEVTTGATTAKTQVDASGRATTTVETRPVIAGVLTATSIKMVSATCE